MQTKDIPAHPRAFADLIRGRFGPPDHSVVTVRQISRPRQPVLTAVYLPGIADPDDIERLVLVPAAQMQTLSAPEALAKSGHFTAPDVQVAHRADDLQEGLLSGMAAIHVAGHPGALLVGSARPVQSSNEFGQDRRTNTVRLQQHLSSPGLRVQTVGGSRTRADVLWLDGVAAPELVRAVSKWAGQQRTDKRPVMDWWRAVIGLFRLPPAVEHLSPAAVAEVVRSGYVAVMVDRGPGALVAPTTIQLLLGGPRDVVLPPVVRRLVPWVRLVAGAVSLTANAAFVAITSYHHTVLPGPFLVALAAARQNKPLPIVTEVLVAELFSLAVLAGSTRLMGRRGEILGIIGAIVGLTILLQAGILAPVPVALAIMGAVSLALLPHLALTRTLQAWRFAFIGAAAGLGLFGVALLAFGLTVYLGEERPFGHPLRRPAGAAG